METAQKYINCPRTRSIFYAAPSFLAYEHYVYQNDKIVFFNVALSYLAYERYIYQHSHGPEEFRYNGSTLAVFKAANPMRVVANGNTLVDLRTILPTELDISISYRFASDMSKRVARLLILIVRQVELEGACIAALGEGNICVSPDAIVALHGVQIQRNLNLAAL